MRRERGITRTVFVGRRWAVKVPSLHYRKPVRGWLANQSEWRQRHRRQVCRPVATLAHVALVMPAADRIGTASEHGPWVGLEPDEGKPSSWGRFGHRWLLVDYDRAWEPPHGLVGAVYYGLQERRARRWMAQ